MSKSNEPDGWDDDPTQDRLYVALRRAFERADAAAKAVARLEHDIAEEYKVTPENEIDSDQVDDNSDPTTVRSAHESNRDFDDTDFNELFDKMNVVRLTSDLADILNLDSRTRVEIINTIVSDQFRSRPARSPREAVGSKTVIGDDLGVFLHNAKQQAARKQASKRRNGEQ